MSAEPCHPALRARIAERLQAMVNASASSVASQLGRVATTMTRRGGEGWPIEEVFILAQNDAELLDTLRVCVNGILPATGDATNVIPELINSLSAANRIEDTALDALRDGRCSPDEARELLRLEADHRRRYDAVLGPALRAAAAAEQGGKRS